MFFRNLGQSGLLAGGDDLFAIVAAVAPHAKFATAAKLVIRTVELGFEDLLRQICEEGFSDGLHYVVRRQGLANHAKDFVLQIIGVSDVEVLKIDLLALALLRFPGLRKDEDQAARATLRRDIH